jgi:exonuclease III
MSDKIKICLYNCQSYNNKWLTINNYIKENNIDIMCLNETFLMENNNTPNLLDNFKMIRQDRGRRGGGVAFLIDNKRIEYKTIASKTTLDYEYIAVEISSSTEKITLLNSYTHPQSKTKFNFYDHIKKHNSNKIIWVGDLNATNIAWYCKSTNTRGKELEKVCFINNMMIVNSDCPTSRKSTNIIDMVICSEAIYDRIDDFVVDKNLDYSDHWPVHFGLLFKPGKRKYKKINWEKFNKEIEEKIQSYRTCLHNKEDLEFEANKLSEDINLSLTNNTSLEESKSRKFNFPNELLKMIKTKKQLQRAFSDSHDPVIKNLINNISNKIKRFNRKLLDEHWNAQCAYLATKKPSEQVYWNVIKKIESGNTHKDNEILPNTKKPEEKARQFSDYYEKIFRNDKSDHNFENIFEPEGQDFARITINEVLSAIKSSKNTSSSGIDGISFKIMKILPLSVIKYITDLFNYSILFKHVPKCWKLAKIKVLRKKDDDLDNPGSYRPISLLVTISRILEKVINIRLTDWAESNKLLHPNQSGFRTNHSCQDNIFKLVETCKVGLQKGLKCAKMDFDIEKAFDKTPHKGILLTLKRNGCPSYIGEWLASFLSNRKFIVEIDGVISDEKNILAGVPQGSPLSPLLFAIFINDIGKLLDQYDINFALFADDLTIWTIQSSLLGIERTLQKAIDDIDLFFQNIGLKLNEKKCTYTIFTSKPNERISLNITNVPVQYEEHPKSLGIYFDPKLKFNYHFIEIKKQLVSKINLLRILSNKSNRLNVNHLLTIYKSLILSKIQYSMIPFLVTSNKIKNELQTIQNKCFKIILNLPIQTSSKLTHQTFKCEKLDKRISILTCNFLVKAKSNNTTFNPIFEAHYSKNIRCTKSKRSVLDRINTITLTPQLSTTQFF